MFQKLGQKPVLEETKMLVLDARYWCNGRTSPPPVCLRNWRLKLHTTLEICSRKNWNTINGHILSMIDILNHRSQAFNPFM